jgi:predicted small lipoprotein YifL
VVPLATVFVVFSLTGCGDAGPKAKPGGDKMADKMGGDKMSDKMADKMGGDKMADKMSDKMGGEKK